VRNWDAAIWFGGELKKNVGLLSQIPLASLELSKERAIGILSLTVTAEWK